MNSWTSKAEADPGPQRARSIEAITAGSLLIFSAIAATAMVWTRLQADIDQPTFEETLAAIDQNTLWYTWHGMARTFFGALLITAAGFIKPAMFLARGWQLRMSSVLLSLGGIAMIISGVLAVFIVAVYWVDTYELESFDHYREITGSIGNTLIGLAIILLSVVQWRLGGFMKPLALLAPFVGIGMILVWLDAATIFHRISGTGFLVWLLATALTLIAGALVSWRTKPTIGCDDGIQKLRI